MAVWFLTIGNSDIQLKNDVNWSTLYDKIRYDDPLVNCDNFSSLGEADKITEYFSVAARVLGLVYKEHKEYYSDLVFPLIETFVKKIPQDSLDKIYLILSDQDKIFSAENKEKPECPFWMDTYTLEGIITHYLNQENRFPNAEIIPIIIKPDNTNLQGIDHWDYTLDLVSQTLIKDLFPSEGEIYVSHQAGTPAISSAVQFISISHSDRLQFLISNQVYDQENQTQKYEAELIPSSKYWQRIQIQKAQKLLREGSPSAAYTLLENVPSIDRSKLRDMVNTFNLKSPVATKDDEFEPIAAAKRVRDALDLIEIFLKNENYLEAIALLAAAHETFIKAAVIYLIKTNNEYLLDDAEYQSLLKKIYWSKEGLCFKACPIKGKSIKNKLLLSRGYFKSYKRNRKLYFKPNNANSFQWLKILIRVHCQIRSKDWVWNNLKWTMKYEREYDDDLRNQMMHNLRGIKKPHLIDYLKGHFNKNDRQNQLDKAEDVFKAEIKTKFVSIMSKIFIKADGVPAISDEIKNHIQDELNTLANSLDKSLSPKNSQ